MKNRSRKRTLTFERLETKATPAMLLVALAPLDDDSHAQIEPIFQEHSSECVDAVDTSGNWQFCHSVVTLLQFVDDATCPVDRQSALCTPPTWDQCRTADEMMKLQDRDLRALVIADGLAASSQSWGD